MAKHGSFVDRHSAMLDDAMRTAERVTRQFDMDSWQIALARYPKLDLGYQRIMEITELAEQVRAEYAAPSSKVRSRICTGCIWTRSCARSQRTAQG